MFCGLKTTESIYHWSEARRVRHFLSKEFSIEKLPKKSQSYNVLTMFNHKQFAIEFEKWIQGFAQGKMKGVTVAIDGGRIEVRTAYVTHKVENIGGHKEWPKLACAGAICREFEKKGKKNKNLALLHIKQTDDGGRVAVSCLR